MPEPRTTARAPAESAELHDTHKALRQLGAQAHQLRAATRAADHFNARDTAEDRDTGSWLMSTALVLSADVVGDIDNLARALKDKPADAPLRNSVSMLRVRAHQLHAAARAADHFLDQDTRDDQDTGSWLVATALTLANKLASELDDAAVPACGGPAVAPDLEPHDPALARLVAAATAPLRGKA
jgi:hypothetical protein